MESRELIELAKELGGVVVVEQGEITAIVLPYERYKKLKQGRAANEASARKKAEKIAEPRKVEIIPASEPIAASENDEEKSGRESFDRLNKEISALREQIEEKEREADLAT